MREELNDILGDISPYWDIDIYGLVEENDQEYYDPILKDIDFSGLIEINELNQYKSEDWNDNFLEITNSKI